MKHFYLWIPFRKTCATIDGKNNMSDHKLLAPNFMSHDAELGWNNKNNVIAWFIHDADLHIPKKARPCMEHLLKSKYPHHLVPGKPIFPPIHSHIPPA